MEHNVTSALNCRDIEGQVVAPRRRRKNGARDIAAAFKGRGELLEAACYRHFAKTLRCGRCCCSPATIPQTPIRYGRGYSRTNTTNNQDFCWSVKLTVVKEDVPAAVSLPRIGYGVRLRRRIVRREAPCLRVRHASHSWVGCDSGACGGVGFVAVEYLPPACSSRGC